eukprot:TRINITY_DN101_c0_g1_i2.p1 TRINITY_DN101_c0_g1~~TRINITY_DN101_c0_g1_i2.p1  ORF type:complete len:323 (+),score=30.33 TRINITY_DN101_c0_g1_i2:105-1073(+)
MRLVASRLAVRRMGCSRPRSQLTSRFAVRCSRFISFSCPIYESGKHSSADQHGTEAANFPSPTNLANNETAAQNDLIVPTDKELAFIGSVLKKLNKPSGVKDQLINDPESPAMRDIRLQQEILYRVRAKQGRSFLWKLLTPLTSRKNELLLTSSAFYVSVREQAEKPAWRGLGLQDNLGNWFNVVMLHMWMVLFRLRNMEDMRTGQSISQFLIDYYFDDVEEGIIKHAETANPIIISKSKKSFVHSYMGAMTSYDHAVLTSDAALADMLYNNIFGLNKDLVTASKLESLIAYIRREMKALDQVSDSQLSLGKYRWGEPPTFV